MKVSYNWLQTYFNDPLPPAEELAEALTFHSFEIEGVEQVGKDTVIDVDVLANRGSDCLCHRGITKEIATILDRNLKRDPLLEPIETNDSEKITIAIKAEELVNRFSLAHVTGVTVGPSPDWLQANLEAIGQKSINNIVDATNYVMFNLGQPLHAFDADKVSGDTKTIGVRAAKKGEKITTLTNDEYELDESNLLIFDGESDTPLAIAGIKGGKVAEVDANTKNIILEAANFDYVSVRKTSQALKLQTDASVRFQNQPSRELTVYALRDVVSLILEIAGGEYRGSADWNPHPQQPTQVSVSLEQINAKLGTGLSSSDVEVILKRFSWDYVLEGENVTVTVPFERNDLTIPEDVIEEVGRMSGYLKLESKQLPTFADTPVINKRFYHADQIRRILSQEGFSEVLTYSLRERGAVELENALASDKSHLRDTLTEGVQEALIKNSYNAPLLGLACVKVFEIGVVWKGLKEDGRANEVLTLAMGVQFPKKVKGTTADDVVREGMAALERELGSTIGAKPQNGIVEINLDKLIEKLPEPKEYAPIEQKEEVKYQPISSYPFVLRDIAVWVPESMRADDVLTSIQREGGDLLIRQELFDEFSKDGRTSYAFHLVFQSFEKTLSDKEVNERMQAIEAALKEKGGEVR